jgi:pantoate--beta-alanine ligase
MRTCFRVAELQSLRAEYRRAGESVAFVPTMGALHAGHLKLVSVAKRSANRVIASIFVNPTQFLPNEDFAAYPRTLKEDLSLLEPLGVDAVFAPNTAEMYAEGAATFVHNPELGAILEGEVRPGHFQGVLTVVTKLFQLVQPQVAVFGKKDYQQLVAIRRMVRDLMMPIEIVGVDTERDVDGMALSSRNRFLSSKDREFGRYLIKALLAIREKYNGGERDRATLEEIGIQLLTSAREIRVDYMTIRDRELKPLQDNVPEAAVALVAAKVGAVRLLDNVELGPA